MEIEILDWDQFNFRRDIKAATWFRLHHDLFEDPQTFSMSHKERSFWIYLLCQASKKSGGKLLLSRPHVEKIGGFQWRDVSPMLKGLESRKLIEIKEETRGRNVDVTGAYADVPTDRQTDRRTDTTKPALPPLASLWNELCKDLPKVVGCSGSRVSAATARWRERPERAYWEEIILRILKSDFCTGRVPGKTWRANFDFLVRPETQHRVLEGAYDNKTGGPSPLPPSKFVAELKKQVEGKK